MIHHEIHRAYEFVKFAFFSPWHGFSLIAVKAGTQEISDRPLWIPAFALKDIFFGCTGMSTQPTRATN